MIKLNRKALTLVELILSVMIAAFVMFGIFSSNQALMKNNQNFGSKYLVNAQTTAALSYMLDQASKAVGHNADPTDDKGILIGSEVGDTNSFCVHQDDGVAGDTWKCFTLNSNHAIIYCNETYSTATPRGNPTKCSNGTLLAAAHSMQPVFTIDSSAHQLSFSLTINDCFDNTASTCFGDTRDDARNPNVTKTGSVVPALHTI